MRSRALSWKKREYSSNIDGLLEKDEWIQYCKRENYLERKEGIDYAFSFCRWI
jgi:hypothetical protein